MLELLVVIVVIAILAALLFPTVRSAKDKARRTTCLNNLRQINLGVRMYSDDSRDASPSSGSAAVFTNIVTLYSAYKGLMKSYVGLMGASSPRDRLFACPADLFYPSFVDGITQRFDLMNNNDYGMTSDIRRFRWTFDKLCPAGGC